MNDQITLLQRIVDDIVDTEKKSILTNYIAMHNAHLHETTIDSPALTEGV